MVTRYIVSQAEADLLGAPFAIWFQRNLPDIVPGDIRRFILDSAFGYALAIYVETDNDREETDLNIAIQTDLAGPVETRATKAYWLERDAYPGEWAKPGISDRQLEAS